MPERSRSNGRLVTLDHLKKKTPLRRTVPVVLDDGPIEAVAAAESVLRSAQQEYDSWVADRRDLQMRALQSLPMEDRKAFIANLPDPPGADERLKTLETAKEGLQAAKEAVRKATVYVTLQAVGRKRYEALVDAHPATDEQNVEHTADHGAPAPYNGDTFPLALISESAVEPEMPLEYVQQIWDEWNSAELTDLFSAALMVNTFRRSADLGNA